MSRKVIPGIYRIRNTVNGKVYIGQSKDILRRFRQYYWETYDTKSTDRPIIQAMREFGYDRFEFAILTAGPKYVDVDARLEAEAEYIKRYNAQDPEYGYNTTTGGETGVLCPRQQSLIERYRRAIPAFEYNINTQTVMYYLTGAAGIARNYNTDKAIASHALNRGDVFMGNLYLIPAFRKDRYRIVDRKIAKLNAVLEKHGHVQNKHTQLAKNNFDRYMEAVEYIDTVAMEYGID